jgi:site-specific recombinase XerD
MSTITKNDTQISFLRGTFEGTVLPIENLIERYLYYAENVKEYAPTTLKQRRIYLEQFHSYLLETDTDVCSLTNIDLDFYFISLAKRCHLKCPGKQISTGTVNTSKRSVKGFLSWCENYIELPLRVKLSEVKEREPKGRHPDILTHNEIMLVIKQTTSQQDKLMISVIYEAGLRISELGNMRIDHLRGRTLDVVGKGDKHRITYLSAPLVREIKAWMRVNRWKDGYVFRPLQHGTGEGYTNTDTIRQRIKEDFRRVLGRDMHPHMLRHAFALRLLKKGCDLRSIQKMLGHTKIETTMIYLNIDDSHLERQHAQSFTRTVYG